MFPGSRLLAGPKHSTNVPFSTGVAVTLSVDVKEVARVLNPVPGVAMKVKPAPQTEKEADLWTSTHSLLPPTLQMVKPFMSPVTIQLKVKVSPGQVGGVAVNCPITSSAWKDI